MVDQNSTFVMVVVVVVVLVVLVIIVVMVIVMVVAVVVVMAGLHPVPALHCGHQNELFYKCSVSSSTCVLFCWLLA